MFDIPVTLFFMKRTENTLKVLSGIAKVKPKKDTTSPRMLQREKREQRIQHLYIQLEKYKIIDKIIIITLTTIEKEVASLTTHFANSCRAMNLIFTGILSLEKNSRYDSLVNIATIQGKTNILFRQQMKDVNVGFGDVLDLIKNLEAIDISYGNKS